MEKKTIGVGIIGFGTVGAGVAHGLLSNGALIKQRTGLELELMQIADLDIETDRGIEVDPALFTTEASALIENPDVDIVVELIGGTGVAKTLTLNALQRGKAVVTANKALLAECGKDVFDAAEKAGVDLFFEASVAGGIPLIKVLREGLVGNRFVSIFGILNGTCNYILTRMENQELDFDFVLQEAQNAGFAEAEPSLDIDGIDTAHKVCLLANLAFGHSVSMKDIRIEGIRDMAEDDLQYAAELGYKIKLLAVLKRHDIKVEIRVHPTLIPKDHMLGKVDGAFNAAFVNSDLVGQSMYYGPGAGRFPTASAVIADIVDVARNLSGDGPFRFPAGWSYNSEGCKLLAQGESCVRFYLRMHLLDQLGILGEVTKILGEHGISIASVIQQERNIDDFAPVVILTHSCLEKSLCAALETLQSMTCVGSHIVKIIIEDMYENGNSNIGRCD